MPLHLISGRANTGKTGLAYARLRETVETGGRGLLVLPTMPDVIRARRELANSTPLGLQVSTFDGLISSLWNEHGDGRVMRNAGYRSLALTALAEQSDIKQSLVSLASRCIAAAQEAAGEGWRSASGSTPEVGRELARLMRAYARHLDQTDSIEVVEAAHFIARLPVRVADVALFHRFTDFSEWERTVVLGLGCETQVIVSLNWAEDLPASQLLDSWVHEVPWNTHVEAYEAEFNTQEALTELGNSLFAEPSRVGDDGSVRMCTAEGSQAEARGIAAEVLLALREGHAEEPGSIAVAYRNLQPHYHALLGAFRDAGVPAQFDVAQPLSLTGYGSALLEALRFARYERRASLLNLLRSPFSGVSASDARTLERSWRRNAVDHSSTMLRDLRTPGAPLARALADLLGSQHGPLGPAGILAIARLASLLFANARQNADDTDERVAEDASAHRTAMDVLSTAAEMGESAPSFAGLIEALGQAAVSPSSAERTGHVQVLPVSRLRGRRFDVVILGGLNAGEFPAAPSETAFPGAALDRVIQAFGGRSSVIEGDLFDRTLFYDAVTRARRRLVLSACRTDDDGETLGLSWLFDEVADRVFPVPEGQEAPVHRHSRLIDDPDPHSSAERERDRAAAVRADDCNERARAARARSSIHAGVGAVEGALADPVVSPSQVETYLRCPYRWFYQHVLRPRELERQFDFRDEGEIAHRLLAETYRTLIEQGAVPLVPASLGHAAEVLEAVAESESGPMRADASLVRRIGASRARLWAQRILAQDAARVSEFAPALIEWGFGGDDEPVDLGGVLLRGRVDRVDVAANGRALVVDYKRTCNSAHAAAKMLDEGRVQLPLYLAAVHARTGLEPVAVLYRGLSNAEMRGAADRDRVDDALPLKRTDFLDEEGLAALVEGAVELAREAVRGMQEGRIPAVPKTDSACAGCPVGPACGGRR